MMKIEKFEDIKIWKKARSMVRVINKETYHQEFQKDYGLKDQIRRASVSVTANIAERFGRWSNKDFGNLLNYSRGSAAEVQSHLYIALDLKYITSEIFGRIYREYKKILKMITSFRNYLRNSKSK